MIEKKIELSSGCTVRFNTWDEGFCPPTVDIEYIERAPHGWYSDTETSVDITKEQAIELVKLLKETFNI